MIFKILNLVQIMLKACFFFFCILAVEFVKGGDWLLELVEGTMGSSFNAQILVEKLSKLNNSQASIESILSIILNCFFFFLCMYWFLMYLLIWVVVKLCTFIG